MVCLKTDLANKVQPPNSRYRCRGGNDPLLRGGAARQSGGVCRSFDSAPDKQERLSSTDRGVKPLLQGTEVRSAHTPRPQERERFACSPGAGLRGFSPSFSFQPPREIMIQRTLFPLSPLLYFLALIFSQSSGTVHGQSIRINEILISNSTTIADEDGDYEDWIELHNPTETEVNLNNWGLSDNLAQPFKWMFPEVTLQPGEYLLVWASGKDRHSGGSLHTNFRLNSSGEELLLHDALGIKRDELEPTAVPTDHSYGRTRDDPDAWIVFADATPGTANPGPEGHLLSDTVTFSETSRTFTGSLTLALSARNRAKPFASRRPEPFRPQPQPRIHHH